MKKSVLLFIIIIFSGLQVFSQNQIKVSQGTPVKTEVLFGFNGMSTIQRGCDWGSFGKDFYAKLNEFNLSTLRYPGGTIANWWELYPGKFVDTKKSFGEDKSKTNGLCEMPANYLKASASLDNSLVKFTNAMDATFVKPMLVLNTATSDLASQLAMLHEARMAHVPVRFLELGNEFYNISCVETNLYNDDAVGGSGGKYASLSQKWITALRARFKDVEIASVGATVDKGDTERRKKWNEQANSIWRGSNNNAKPDAVVMHHYIGTGLGKGGERDVKCRVINGTEDWKKIFDTPFKQFDMGVRSEINSHINNGKPGSERFYMWFTEFNMKDHLYYSHGSWCHALFTGLEALVFLESEDTRNIDLHCMLGNAASGAIFSDTKGFDYADERANGISRCTFCKKEVQTHKGTVTALGIVFREIGTAMRNSVSFEKLIFSTKGSNAVPKTAGGRDALYGYTFTDTVGNEQTLIINMSDEEQKISFDASFNNPVKYKTWNFVDPADPGNKKDLNTFVTGEVGNGNIEYFNIENKTPCDLSVKTAPVYQNCTNGSITVARWSITRVVKEVTNAVGAYAMQSTICAGEPVRLIGVGNAVSLVNAQWFENDKAISNKEQSNFIYTPTNAGWHYFKLQTSCCVSSVCSVFVQANPAFEIRKTGGEIISGTNQKLISAGTTFDMYGDNNKLTYTWIPSSALTGSDTFLNAAVKANPVNETTFTLYGTDGVCASKKTVTFK